MTEIYGDTGGDKERCLAIFEKALENYNEGSYAWSRIYHELGDSRKRSGKNGRRRHNTTDKKASYD